MMEKRGPGIDSLNGFCWAAVPAEKEKEDKGNDKTDSDYRDDYGAAEHTGDGDPEEGGGAGAQHRDAGIP